jgi:hypothetical protein
MNKPYVKQYDDTGNLLNPINGFYPGKLFLGFAKDEEGNDTKKPLFYHNRAERRSKKDKYTTNNRKPLSDREKLCRNVFVQSITNEFGQVIKRIKHKLTPQN